MDIKKDYERHSERIIELMKTIQPELTDLHIWALKAELSSFAQTIVIGIGNGINNITEQVKNK